MAPVPRTGHVPMSGHGWGRGKGEKLRHRCPLQDSLLVPRQWCFGVWAGASAGPPGEGCGVGAMATRDAVHGGAPTAAFPPGSGARMLAQARCMPCASRAHTPAPGGTCVGPPEESGDGPGGGNVPVPTTSPGGSGEARRRSRERSRFWARWQESSAGVRSGG